MRSAPLWQPEERPRSPLPSAADPALAPRHQDSSSRSHHLLRRQRLGAQNPSMVGTNKSSDPSIPRIRHQAVSVYLLLFSGTQPMTGVGCFFIFPGYSSVLSHFHQFG